MPLSYSDIWNHCSRINNNEAECDYCHRKLKCIGSSTSGVKRHLEEQHHIKLNSEAKRPKYSSNQPSITGHIPIITNSLGERLSRYAAVDGFSIHAITNSEQIRDYLRIKGFSVPKTHGGTMKEIKKFSEEIKEKTRKTIKKMIENNQRFSVDLDEYTGINNRRFMNVTLHHSKGIINLGM